MASRSFGRVLTNTRYRCEDRARLSLVVERAVRPASGNANLLLFHQRQEGPCCSVVGTNGGAARSTSTRATPKRGPRVAVARPPNPRRLSPDSRGGGGGDDEYRWMHDINSDEVLRHLERENRYSAAHLRPLRRRASELFRCMMDRQPEEEGGDRRSVPERLGSYLYYTRRDDGKGFPVYVRRPVGSTVDEGEQVVFDLNEVEEHGLRAIRGGGSGGGGSDGQEEQEEEEEVLGQAAPTPALGAMKLSSDQRMLACTIDVDGTDRFVLAVFDLLGGAGETARARGGRTPQQGPPPAAVVTVLREDAMWDDVVGVEWGSSWPPTEAGSGGGGGDPQNCRSYELYYTVPDDLRRPWQVRRVTLHRGTGTAAAAGRGVEPGGAATGGSWRVDSAGDTAVFAETNDAFFVDVGKTKDHAFVVVNVHSKTTSEVYVLPAVAVSANDGSGDGGVVASRSDGSRRLGGARPTLLRRRRQGVEYYVDHSGDAFYLVTNSPPPKDEDEDVVDGARDGRSEAATGEAASGAGEYHLVRVRHPPGPAGSASSLEGIADAPWQPVPHGRNGGGGTIQEMDLFKDHCVLYESCPATGCPRLRVVPLPAAAGSCSSSSSLSPFVVSPPAVGGCGGGGGGGDRTGDSSPSGSARDSDRGSGTDIDTIDSIVDIDQGGVAAAAAAAAAARACTLRPGVNSWFEARTARFSLSSPTAPEDVYDLCLESGRMELRRRTEVPGSPRFDGRDYSCYTTQVASRHGETVPLTIVHRRGVQLDGRNRLLLHGYGAYGMSLPIDYHPSHACMLERGWVFAFAHVRGGGERGKAWHAAGRGPNKWNSFWDFQACAEHLVSQGFTSPSSMGAHVNSAGGLLAGVMANTRPGLFSAMVLKAPFLGVLSAMRDSSLPLTVHEFDEWGDPNSSEQAAATIRSYCPYENVREQDYPALLVTASLNDSRVNVWDPAKWVSRVRAANTGRSPVLLRVSDTDGHHGPGNTLDGLKDSALEMAFLEKHLKVCKAS